MIWWRNETSPEFQFGFSLLLALSVWSASSSGTDFLSPLCQKQRGPWPGKADLWECTPIQISVSNNIMTSEGAECAVRSWFTSKDPCERALGRPVHSGEWHHGSSHHSQPAQREKLSPVRDNFFSHGLFSEKVGKDGWVSHCLFCFPAFFFNSDACQLKRWNSFADVCIFPLSSFIFPAVLTPLKITFQRTYTHTSHLSSMLIFLLFSFFCKWKQRFWRLGS